MSTEKKSFGAELQRIRNFRKLSLREVEKAIGISNPYLSQLENDKIKKPSPHYLYKLSSLYNVDYQLLMKYAGYADTKTEDSGPKTLAGAALFSTSELTPKEEEELMDYLGYLRRNKK